MEPEIFGTDLLVPRRSPRKDCEIRKQEYGSKIYFLANFRGGSMCFVFNFLKKYDV